MSTSPAASRPKDHISLLASSSLSQPLLSHTSFPTSRCIPACVDVGVQSSPGTALVPVDATGLAAVTDKQWMLQV